MDFYFVNDNSQPTGEHEVHKMGCVWLDKASSKTPLGSHGSCHSAVATARRFYDDVDGCAFCIPICHTK